MTGNILEREIDQKKGGGRLINFYVQFAM